jgi:hypothetical protein
MIAPPSTHMQKLNSLIDNDYQLLCYACYAFVSTAYTRVDCTKPDQTAFSTTDRALGGRIPAT